MAVKRFRFRLETVLSIRRQREDQQKRVVAARLRQLGALRRQAQTLDIQISREVEAARDMLHPGPLEAQRVARHRFWLGHLRRLGHDTEQRIAEADGALAGERQVLSQRATERKVLEKLREILEARHRAETARGERAEADELAIAQAARTADQGEGETE